MKTVRQKAQAEALHYRQADPLPVMEHFYTLQGEGAWTGTASYFIRLAGCDIGCHWCDVKESWTPREDQYLSAAAITELALTSQTERVVITGGEQSIYDLSILCKNLHQAGLKIHMETAGVHELEAVIFHEKDLIWAEQHAARCASHVQLYLQPEWSRIDRITPHLIEHVKAHPRWKLSLQTHKYIDIP